MFMMEDPYEVHPSISCTENDEMFGVRNLSINEDRSGGCSGLNHSDQFQFQTAAMEELVGGGGGSRPSDMPDLIKSRVANHPLYPKLLSSYIECLKVGASPETVSILEEIGNESVAISDGVACIGDDPELDDFMEMFCGVLYKYKEELLKPLIEATKFLTAVESQLSHLCNVQITTTTTAGNYNSGCTKQGAGREPDRELVIRTQQKSSYRGAESSEEDASGGELEATESQEFSLGDQDLKEALFRKYSGCISNLRKEFLKKRTKGKLPNDARNVLLNWWNAHFRWPYPTEEEKMKLSEITRLGEKQINNWFINQRKRHWRPSEDIRFSLREGVSAGSIRAHSYFDAAGGVGNVDT